MKKNSNVFKTIFNIMIAFTLVFASFSLPTVFNAEGLDETTTQNENTVENETTEIIEETEEQAEEVEEYIAPDTYLSDVETRDGTNNSGVSISIPNAQNLQFQTYNDPITGQGPTHLTVPIAVVVDKIGETGVTLEVPYGGYMPSLGHEDYQYFDMTEDIFKFEEPANIGAGSIVQEYIDDTINHKIIVVFKPTVQTVETINLRFEFNQNYSAEIPPQQIIWSDAQVVLKQNDVKIDETEKFDVKSSAIAGMDTYFTLNEPIDASQVVDDPVIVSVGHKNDYNLYALLDNEFEGNEYYIEHPSNLEVEFNAVNFNTFENAIISEENGIKRYTVKFKDEKEYFNFWNHTSNVNKNYNNVRLFLTGFNKMNVGEQAKITSGMTYKKINGKVENIEAETVYTKSESKKFEMIVPPFHDSYNRVNHIVDTENADSTGENAIFLGLDDYGSSNSIKNKGADDVKDVVLSLEQKSQDYKVNFSEMIFVIKRETPEVPQMFHRYEIEFRHGVTGEITREVKSDTSSNSEFFRVPLPELEEHEYINKISLIPMGITSSKDNFGKLPPKTSITIRWKAKNWNSFEWPSGVPISDSVVYDVPVGGTLEYLDETNGENPFLQTNIMEEKKVIYAPGNAVDAEAFLVSGTSQNVAPEDIVDFEIQGYNRGDSVSDTWENPIVSIRLPKEFEVINPTAKRAYIDDKNVMQDKKVSGRLVKQTPTHNFYQFTVDGIVKKHASNIAFKIPLQIKVNPGTKVGQYNIAGTVVSGTDFIQASQKMNTLTDTRAEEYGYNNQADKYSVSKTSGNSSIVVVPETKVVVETKSRGSNSATDPWSSSDYFGIAPNATPQMNATIINTGNSVFKNLRFYDILPSSQDGRGSSGNVAFTGLDAEGTPGGTVYYTTKAVSELPKYGTPEANLQTWTTTKLGELGFEQTPPADLSTVTAIYIDYGSMSIQPGQPVEVIMNFKIPNALNQVAKNQFIFSTVEDVTGVDPILSSEEITFSTEIGQITYRENKPTLSDGTPTAGTISDMPEPLTASTPLDDVLKTGSLDVTDSEPTLEGYQFKGWKDEASGETFTKGQTVQFNRNTNPDTLLNFDAIWEPNKYKINFDNNGGEGTMTPQTMTYDEKVALSDHGFNRTGYSFEGWTTSATGAKIYSDKEAVMNLVKENNGSTTLYAVWTPNKYIVQFNANGGTPNTPYTEEYTYGVTSAFPAVQFERTGYKFEGWSTTQGDDNEVDHPYDKPVINLIPSGTLPLYAVWSEIDYEIEVDLDGGELKSGVTIPTTYTVNTPTITLPTATEITKAGYTFAGWSDGTNTVTTIAGGSTGKVELTAQWNIVTYNITTELDGGKIETGSEIPATYTVETDTITLPTATEITKKGHNFEGWTDADGDAIAQISKGSIGDVELTANWKKAKYTLSFNLDGKGQAPTAREVEYDAEVGALPEPEVVGFKFKGWSTEVNGGGTPYNATTKMPANNVTLIANWSQNDKGIETTAKNVNIKLVDAAAFTGEGLFTATYIETDEQGDIDVSETVPAANITIDATKLAAINDATEEGVYKLTYTAAYKGETESRTIDVIITKDLIDPLPTEKTVIILANNFNIKLDDVKNANLVEKANARAFEIDENLKVTREDVTVTLETAKPTTAGKHELTYKAETTEKTVDALVYNEDPVANEVVTANGFTIKLEAVEGADFVALAGAQGYDITDPENPVEINAVLTSAKPTTVGAHTARFETAGGAFAEVTVLVTNEDIDLPEDGEFKEVVTARNFTVKLDEVAGANFVTLAEAKGYKINDKGQVVEEGLTVTLSSPKPTMAGKFDAKFKTANSAETRVDVYVSNEDPVTNEIVTANGFTIALKDVEDADFIALAGAKGYDVTSKENISEIAVELKSPKPTTVGAHEARFETAGGAFAKVTVLVTNEDIDLPEDGEFKEVVTARNFTVELAEVANADFVDLAEAKGYKINDKGQIVEEDLTVTLSSPKPTMAGKFDAKFKTANSAETRVDVYVSNEAVKNSEIVTAHGFTIALKDVENANFIELADAKGYNVSSKENIAEIAVELKSPKPTTVGLHTARFETAGGAFAEVKVLVTNEDIDLPDENETKEVVIAHGFTVGLADVQGANFVALAGAKGYEIDHKGEVITEDLPVSLTSEKPVTIGKAQATFATATSAPVTVDILVTKETPILPPEGETAEVIIAHDFDVELNDAQTADFAALARAEGYVINHRGEIVGTVAVTSNTAAPTTVGAHEVVLETAAGKTETVTMTVYVKGDLVLEAKDVVMTLKDFKAIKTANLEAEILKRSDAKVVNTETGAVSTDGFTVDVSPLTNINAVGTYKTTIEYNLDVDTQPRTRAAGQTTQRTLEKEVIITVTNDPTDPSLPTTGESIAETIVTSMFVIILSMVLVLFGNRKKHYNEK